MQSHMQSCHVLLDLKRRYSSVQLYIHVDAIFRAVALADKFETISRTRVLNLVVQSAAGGWTADRYETMHDNLGRNRTI